MNNSNEYGFKSQKSISRLQLSWYIVLRSVAIGLISGGVLGVLFCLWFFVFTGMLGAGLGLGLGLVNGLLVSVITCLFFYPLKHIRLYHVAVKVISASVAGVGVGIFGPWYFSSTPMTIPYFFMETQGKRIIDNKSGEREGQRKKRFLVQALPLINYFLD
jgi:hypothetical protein